MLFASCAVHKDASNRKFSSNSNGISSSENSSPSSLTQKEVLDNNTDQPSSLPHLEKDNAFEGNCIGTKKEKNFIDSMGNSILSDDGNLYILSTEPEDRNHIVFRLVSSGVQKLNTAFTSDERPYYQTNDNKFYDGLDGTEYKHHFSKSYILSGNNIVIDKETGSIYRVDWSKEKIISDDDMQYIMLGKDATDLTFYVEAKKNTM